MTKPVEDDEFWRLALMSNEQRKVEAAPNYDDDEPDVTITQGANKRLKTYNLPDDITLSVSNLAESEGVMSPLGAQAWHASSLLAAYLIHHKDSLLRGTTVKDHDIHCMELGSGAVGLSGMTLAAVLNNLYSDASVLLTDLATERGVLETLQDNVSRNEHVFPNIDVRVQALDWNDFTDSEYVPSLPPFDFVIGSELIYTTETAVACAAVVTRLLHDNPNLMILIIQVVDRPGFETHFLPLLRQEFDVCVEQPLDAELHDAASTIVASVGDQLGGTLDRFAYGSCWIRRRAMISDPIGG